MPAVERLPTTVLVAGVMLAAAGIITFTESSFYYADDWLNFFLADERGLNWDYLRLGYFGQVAPGHRLMDWVALTVFDMSWAFAIVFQIAVWAVGVAAFWTLARELAGHGPLAVTATLLFAASPVWIRLFQWWASSMHVLPALALTTVAVAAGVRWSRTRSRAALCLTGGAVATGLLFYPKPAFVAVYLGLALGFVMAPSLRSRALAAHLRTLWPLLAVLAGICVTYLVLVRAGGYSDVQEVPGLETWRQYLGLAWMRGTTPLLLGQNVPEASVGWQELVVVAGQLVLAVLVAWSIALRRSAWRAWAAYLVFWLVNVGLIGLGRLAAFGPGIGYDLRYEAEFALLLPFTLLLAFGSTAAQRAPSAPLVAGAARTLRGLGQRRRPILLALWPVPVVLLLASSATSYERVEEPWPAPKSGTWTDNIQQGVANLRSSGVEPVLLDGMVPYDVQPGAVAPFSSISSLVPLFIDDEVAFNDGPATQPLFVLGEDGVPRRVARSGVVERDAPAAASDDLLQATTDSDDLRLRGDRMCLTAPAGRPATMELLPLPGAEQTNFLELTFGDVPRAGSVELFLDQGTGFPALADRTVAVDQPQVLRLGLPLDAPFRVGLRLPPGAAMCLDDIAQSAVS